MDYDKSTMQELRQMVSARTGTMPNVMVPKQQLIQILRQQEDLPQVKPRSHVQHRVAKSLDGKRQKSQQQVVFSPLQVRATSKQTQNPDANRITDFIQQNKVKMIILFLSALLFDLALLLYRLFNQIEFFIPSISALALKCILPTKPIAQSRMFSISQPNSCQSHAYCDEMNQVLSCDGGYSLIPSYYSINDLLFLIKNTLYNLQQRVNKAQNQPTNFITIYITRKCIIDKTRKMEIAKFSKQYSLQLVSDALSYIVKNRQMAKCIIDEDSCSSAYTQISITYELSDEVLEDVCSKLGKCLNNTIYVENNVIRNYIGILDYLKLMVIADPLRFVIGLIKGTIKKTVYASIVLIFIRQYTVNKLLKQAKQYIRQRSKQSALIQRVTSLQLRQRLQLPRFFSDYYFQQVQQRLVQCKTINCSVCYSQLGDALYEFWPGIFEFEKKDYSQSQLNEESTHDISY